MGLRVLVLNGPNLNLLGTREPGIYGRETLHDVEQKVVQLGEKLGCTIECYQSNHEGEMIDRIQQSGSDGVDVIILNAAAYTHTSVGVCDALTGVNIRFYEVHISNVYARDQFRHHSYLSDKAVAVISGLGTFGYEAALMHAAAVSHSTRK